MPKFELGQVVATPGALSALRSSGQTTTEFLRKHVSGDWGTLDGHDEKQNQIALREGGRLVTAYLSRTESSRPVPDRILTAFVAEFRVY